jgi:hypothetical protein
MKGQHLFFAKKGRGLKMLNLYHVKVKGRIDYDMFKGFIVLAKNENEAAKLARETIYEFHGRERRHSENFRIKEINLDQIKAPVVLLSSYNAG